MDKKILLLVLAVTAVLTLAAPFRVHACPPAPTCSISASPNPTTAPQATTLTWTSTNCSSASINQGIGAVGCNSNTSKSPLSSITYTMTVTNSCSVQATCNVTVTVNAGTYQTTFTQNVAELVNLTITNAISKASGSFVIDHPLDPANKLLFHSFVESPDAKNMYDGIATLGGSGAATVRLPNYFEALNKDFRYQLKPIDAPMPNLHVKEEIKDNQFAIGGGVPGGRVSWQVTGTRHDAYIEANPIVVEVEKGPGQPVMKGEYLYPEGYESSIVFNFRNAPLAPFGALPWWSR